MKKIFLIFALALLILPASVAAIDLGINRTKGAAKEAGYSESTGVTTFSETLGVVINIALSFVGVIFLILMVYAGFLWMTARGDEGKVDKAQDIIRAAVIGLVIAAGAYSITNFVVPRILERTTGPGGGDTTVGGGAQQDRRVQCCMRCQAPGRPGCETVVVTGQRECNARCSTGGRCQLIETNANACGGYAE